MQSEIKIEVLDIGEQDSDFNIRCFRKTDLEMS